MYHGCCIEACQSLPDEHFDAIVTDPPYGLEFMGKNWDHGVPGVPFWYEFLRVAKPGAHLLAFGGSRTFHRLACAIEDAGWEIRDTIMWVCGSGFPKSLDVSKAIDKAAGAEREVVGIRSYAEGHVQRSSQDKLSPPIGTFERKQDERLDTAPATDAARQWNGWGTALKPAHEPIIVARKPLKGTVAANVLEYGTGAINVDACRVDANGDKLGGGHSSKGQQMSGGWRRPWMDNADAVQENIDRSKASVAKSEQLGRWPANVIHDGSEEVLALFPQTKSGKQGPNGHTRNTDKHRNTYAAFEGQRCEGDVLYGDSGSAARFFYCAKASRAERNGSKHPTVKPLSLMRYLVRLVTPPGGLVLDPFAGSGTTVEAALLEEMRVVACELDSDNQGFIEDIKHRIQRARKQDLPLFS